jgi:thiol-disulfide isomerase/thioredoxin
VRGLRHRAVKVVGVALSAALMFALVTLAGCAPASSSAPRRAAPFFAGTTLDGAQVSLSDYQGKPLVLVFMASWCDSCIAEAPEIEQFYRDNKGRVAVLGVALQDSEAAMRDLMVTNGWTFPVIFNGTSVGYAYGVSPIPAIAVIDPEGRIAKRLVGPTSAAKLSLIVDGITR